MSVPHAPAGACWPEIPRLFVASPQPHTWPAKCSINGSRISIQCFALCTTVQFFSQRRFILEGARSCCCTTAPATHSSWIKCSEDADGVWRHAERPAGTIPDGCPGPACARCRAKCGSLSALPTAGPCSTKGVRKVRKMLIGRGFCGSAPAWVFRFTAGNPVHFA